jgi:hypothetical protein
MAYGDETTVTTTESQTPVAQREETASEHIMSSIWRPMMGFTYMIICLFDFVAGPMMNALLAFYSHKDLVPWKSLTMSEGGMFHISMGAILGVAAWARNQEKKTTS